MKKPLRILVAHNVSRCRNGGMSRLMGFIHDHLVDAGHQVEYLCADDVPAGLSSRLSRFTFPILARRRAVVAARTGKPFDLVNVVESRSVCLAPAADVAAMAELTEQLLGDEAERNRLRAAARGLYQERFDVRHTIEALREAGKAALRYRSHWPA